MGKMKCNNNPTFYHLHTDNDKYGIFFVKRERAAFIKVNGKIINCGKYFEPVKKVYNEVRKFFPYAYWIGLHDCDSGGRIFNSFTIIAWNYWHLKKLERSISGMGDGETWHQVSVMRTIKQKIKEKWNGNKSGDMY